jgi:hypothetical protein
VLTFAAPLSLAQAFSWHAPQHPEKIKFPSVPQLLSAIEWLYSPEQKKPWPAEAQKDKVSCKFFMLRPCNPPRTLVCSHGGCLL